MRYETKQKKHIAAKAAAVILAGGLISAGSIQVYKTINSPQTVVTQSEKSLTDSLISPETVSHVKEMIDVSDTPLLTAEEAVAKVLPTVVGIESQFGEFKSHENGKDDYQYPSFFGFDFGMFGGEENADAMTGTGTGVILSEDGYIVTNAHVIYDSEYGLELAKKIKVLMANDDEHEATVVGYDTDCDIAVLKIEAEGLTPAEFGDSDNLQLGQSVIAIGNPLGFDLMNTVTAGIVSGLNRQIEISDKNMTLLQTDAAINSGNSGGPLINLYGQVIGINSSKMSASFNETAIEGIGFAIPSNEVGTIVNELMSHGYVTGKPSLGISCVTVTEEVSSMYGMQLGIYVSEVTNGSASETAGIQKGDIITAVNGETVETVEELNAAKNMHNAGDTITITLVRYGESMDVNVTLDEDSITE